MTNKKSKSKITNTPQQHNERDLHFRRVTQETQLQTFAALFSAYLWNARTKALSLTFKQDQNYDIVIIVAIRW